MQIISDRQSLTHQIDKWKKQGHAIGFVPTMGALHEGHLSLVKLAQDKTDKCVVSIFVNPTQFAPHEDFDSYPRDVEGDAKKLSELGVDVIYTPSKDEIYAEGMGTEIKAGEAALGLETGFRPHFFGGVVNVVSRLFGHVQPDIAVFGEKDFQQMQVIREMVETYDMPVEIIGGKIIRDKDGLALSSRNAYLSEKELLVAKQLNKIIAEANVEDANQALLDAGFDKVDYVEKRWGRILAAAWIGKTRLIDNIAV